MLGTQKNSSRSLFAALTRAADTAALYVGDIIDEILAVSNVAISSGELEVGSAKSLEMLSLTDTQIEVISMHFNTLLGYLSRHLSAEQPLARLKKLADDPSSVLLGMCPLVSQKFYPGVLLRFLMYSRICVEIEQHSESSLRVSTRQFVLATGL